MRRRYYRRKKGIAKKETPFFKEAKPMVQTKEEKQPFFQAKENEKLTVGQPGDKYEVEADAMADAVMNNSKAPAAIQSKEISSIQKAEEEEAVQARIQRQAKEEEPALQTQSKEEEVQAKSEEEEVQMQTEEEEVQTKSEEEEVQMQAEEEEIQAKSEEEEVQMQGQEEEVQTKEEEEPAVQMKTNGKPKANNKLSSQIKQSSGTGNQMDTKTRKKMEAGFGVDFSKVSIHTNSEAVQMNKELHAHAFTHGNDIYFNNGKYQPETSAGQHLLAHELTHVVQQSKSENCKKINRTHFSSGYTSWAAIPHQMAGDEERTYSLEFYINAALEINLVEGLDSNTVKGLIEQSMNRHGGGWKNIVNEEGQTTRVYVNFNIRWISFDTISTEVLSGEALGISVLPEEVFTGVPIDGLFSHDGDTNRIILKGNPAQDALLRGRRNRERRRRGEVRFGNEVTHEMGHALGLEHMAHTVMTRANTESAVMELNGDQIKQILLRTTRNRALLPSWVSVSQTQATNE